MIAGSVTRRVYAYAAPVDMRKGYDGLSAVVRESLESDPLSGDLYLFVSRNRIRAKVLSFKRVALKSQSVSQSVKSSTQKSALKSRFMSQPIRIFSFCSFVSFSRNLIPDQNHLPLQSVFSTSFSSSLFPFRYPNPDVSFSC